MTAAMVGDASAARRLVGLVRAARPGQWIKNLACLAGLIFSGRLFDPGAVIASGWTFAGFCLASSGVYLLNDLFDRPYDRRNPKKRGRPIASGLVPAAWAAVASGGLMLGATGLSLLLPPICPVLIATYLALNVAYSWRFKHTVLIDVTIIAAGFVIRVLYGVYAVGVKPTPWIVLCMFFLALFLGFAKRRCELHQADGEGPHRRPVLGKYRPAYLDTLLAMMATMAILCYALYTVTGRPGNSTLVVTVPLVTYGIIRYMLLVMIHGAGESPERLLVSDRVLIATVLIWGALCVLILYNPQISLFKE